MKLILIDTVSDKSKGNMVLSLDEIDFNPFEKTIKIFELKLQSSMSDSNNQKQTQLNQLSFDSVTVSGFEILELLFERKIKATKVLTAKPEMLFLKADAEKRSKSSLSNHLKSVHENSRGLSMFPIEIDLLKVEYGNVVFESDSTKEYLGSADFMVELHNFNTTSDTLEFDSHSFLFSRRLIIGVTNFVKPLNDSRNLSVKEIKFDSKSDILYISDFYLNRGGSGEIDSIFVNRVEIAGLSISEIKNEQDLIIQSIMVDGGFFGIKAVGKGTESNKEKTKAIIEDIFPYIKEIDIDTMALVNIDGELMNIDSKRIAFVESAGLRFIGLKIDTSMYYQNIYPNFDLFEFGIRNFSFDSTQKIRAEDISYSTLTKQLKVSNVMFNDTLAAFNFDSKSVEVNGLDMRKILDKKINTLVLKLTNPDVSINLSSGYTNNKNNSKHKGFAELFKLDKLIADNANIKLFDNEGFNIGVIGLDISFGITDINNGVSSKVSFANLEWASRNIDVSIADKNISFNSAASSFEDNKLNLKNGKLSFSESGVDSKMIDFEFHDFIVNDIEIHNIIELKGFKAGNIILDKPAIVVSLNLNDSTAKNKNNDSLLIELPFEIEFGELAFKDGNVDINLDKNNRKNIFTSDFGLLIKDIKFNKQISFDEIQQLWLELKLENSIFETDNILASVEDINFASIDSSLSLKKIDLKIDSLSLQNTSISSNKFQIDSVSISSINYIDVFKDHEFRFSKLMIYKPELDLVSWDKPILKNTQFEDDHKNVGIGKVFFNELGLEDLSLDYNIISNGFKKNVSVGDFDILWTPQEGSTNLLSELHLSINDFELFDYKDSVKIEIGRVFTSPLENDLEFSGLIIDKYVTENDNGFYLRVPQLSFKNIVHNNQGSYKIEIDELETDTLFLEFNNRESEQKQLSFTGRVEALEKYSDLVNRFNIKMSRFNNVDLKINNISDTIQKEFFINQMDIYAYNAGFSSGDSSMLHLNNIKLDVNDWSFVTKDSMYVLTLGDIYYDFSSSSISIDSFKMKPIFTRDEFFSKAVFQTTMLDISGRKIVLSGIDFQRAISQKEYIISSVDLEGFNLLAYRDKKYPFKHGIEKPFPSEVLRSLKSGFFIDTVRVDDSFIRFGEYVAGSTIPGEIFFTDVNVMGRELSNMPELMASPPIIKLGFNSKIMGNTSLTSNIEFPLFEKGFSYSGKTDVLDLRDFNSMTQNLFGISITKGKGKVNITGINAGDSIATGSLIFKYRNLRVRLYNREKAKLHKGIASPFFSFLVNDVLIKSNNPRFLGKTRTGLVYIAPDREKAFINYIWKGILSGMMSTLWHNSKEQRKEKRTEKRTEKRRIKESLE